MNTNNNSEKFWLMIKILAQGLFIRYKISHIKIQGRNQKVIITIQEIFKRKRIIRDLHHKRYLYALQSLLLIIQTIVSTEIILFSLKILNKSKCTVKDMHRLEIFRIEKHRKVLDKVEMIS